MTLQSSVTTREVPLSEALENARNCDSAAKTLIEDRLSEWSGPFRIYDGDTEIDGEFVIDSLPTIVWGDLEVHGCVYESKGPDPRLLIVLGDLIANHVASRFDICVAGNLHSSGVVYGESLGKHALVVGGVTHAHTLVCGAHWFRLMGGADARYVYGHIDDVPHSGFMAAELLEAAVLDMDGMDEELHDAAISRTAMIDALVRGANVVQPDPSTRRSTMLRDLESVSETEELTPVLVLEDAGLTEVPEEVFMANGLERLVLDFNDLTSLPDRIGELTTLKVLSLDNAPLRRLPNSIGDLFRLESLSLRYVRLKALPDSVGELENLKEIYLTYSALEEFPKALQRLTKLEKVAFWHCIPDDDEKLEAMLKGLAGIASLRRLEFNSGEISSFPDALAGLVQLEELRVTDLALDDLALAEIHRRLPRVRVRTNF